MFLDNGVLRLRCYVRLEDIQDLVICVDVCIFPQVIAALLRRLLTQHRACRRLRDRDPWIYIVFVFFWFLFKSLKFWICIFGCLYLYLYFVLHRACWRLRARDPWIYCICIFWFLFKSLKFWLCIFGCLYLHLYLYLYCVLQRACWRLRARDPWILHNQQWHTVTKLPSSLFHNHPICQHISIDPCFASGLVHWS